MTALLAASVALLGGVGAGLRWLIDRWLHPLRRGGFPWPILVVNVVGSFALASLVGVSTTAADPLARVALTAVGSGLLGGFTTFSTVSVDAAELWRRGRRGAALGNALGSAALCAVAALTGIVLWVPLL